MRTGPVPRSDGERSLFAFARWREGRHWQIDTLCLSVWVGIAGDRWMVGVILNTEAWNLGFGLGPLYFGIGGGRV